MGHISVQMAASRNPAMMRPGLASMMLRISNLSPEEIRAHIDESNRDSYKVEARYICWENRALHLDYDFISCPCRPECWCRRKGCLGHYRIKDISFGQFLETYVTLWIRLRARDNVKRSVLTCKPLKGREENAVAALNWLQQNWSASLAKARACMKCGLCDPNIGIERRVENLYEAKMWSQLFYDVLVPYDNGSFRRIRRAGHTTTDFLTMNRELFRDLRSFADQHELDVPSIRRLDSPSAIAPCLPPLAGGQPLSRVLDKIFYSPKKR